MQPTSPSAPPSQPYVSLVGAGPGDPELLTLKALKRIQNADVVLYDFLVSDAILDLLPAHCERICVGKRASRHTLPQKDINRLIIAHAQTQKNIVRLKGGDPFMFGRGGEEMQELAEAGITCEVIPGISAALGAAAYSGIPLTHRDHAQMVSFVTGHRKMDGDQRDWTRLVSPHSTLVVYMGLSEAAQIADELMAQHYDANTPVAVVAHATLPSQQVVVSDLAHIAQDIATAQLSSPALLIIGSVVQLYQPSV